MSGAACARAGDTRPACCSRRPRDSTRVSREQGTQRARPDGDTMRPAVSLGAGAGAPSSPRPPDAAARSPRPGTEGSVAGGVRREAGGWKRGACCSGCFEGASVPSCMRVVTPGNRRCLLLPAETRKHRQASMPATPGRGANRAFDREQRAWSPATALPPGRPGPVAARTPPSPRL